MSEEKSIIVTNDDGIDSPYIRVLAGKLEEVFPGAVIVIAPESQQSATSHTITLHKPLRVEEREPRRFAASGSPVDCVYLGLMKLAPTPVGLVISGINDGHNLGTDIFYSGTVGGAVEGGLRGIPSIAASLAPRAPEQIERAAMLTVELARAMLEGRLTVAPVLNVNVPSGWSGAVRWTSLGRRFYQDDVHERTDPRGRHYYWIGGGIAGSDLAPGSDCEAIEAGVASISPLHLDLSARQVVDSSPALELNGFHKG